MIVLKTLDRPSALALLPLMFLLLLPSSQAQEAAKTLEWGDRANFNCAKSRGPDTKINYELELEEILANGRSVLIGEPFVADLRELVFVVKNISDRPFAFIQVDVHLREVKTPVQVPFVISGEDRPVSPGEKAELRVPVGKVYNWVKEAVSAQGMELSAIKRGSIEGFIAQKSGQPVGVCVTARDPRNEPPAR
ncbi:MAG TPA: hypothetical protein VE961_05820 [Pyrinomonadaceae bacterium]|nr:hypothetical protein [Pyrinomonadaceae bacterium]